MTTGIDLGEYQAVRWIPCAERLPERGDEVLWWLPGFGFLITARERGVQSDSVTHWMPLPDPPEGAT